MTACWHSSNIAGMKPLQMVCRGRKQAFFFQFSSYLFLFPFFPQGEDNHHVSTTSVHITFSHSIENRLKRTNCQHRITGTRWQGGSGAYFIFHFFSGGKRVFNVPTASVSCGSGWVSVLVKDRGEERGDMGWDQSDSGVPKKFFCLPCLYIVLAIFVQDWWM